MEKILVAGAHGTTGKQVVNLLKESQYFEPVAMLRKTSQMSEFEARNIDVILADLEEDVSHATKGIDKVIFAAGSGGEKVEAVDRDGAIKLIDAAKKDFANEFDHEKNQTRCRAGELVHQRFFFVFLDFRVINFDRPPVEHDVIDRIVDGCRQFLEQCG